MALSLCSTKSFLILFLISAIPIAYIISQDLSPHVFLYHSSGFLRECAKWDPSNRRFLVSFFEGGLGQISVPDDHSPDAAILPELPVVKDADVSGNRSLGIALDLPRNRVLVVFADVPGLKYGAVAAYDLSTWQRLFLTQLSGPNDEKSLADDVAVDPEGNAYVTDAIANKIWKVGKDGEFLSIIRSPLFTPKQWYQNLVGLNGIVYHPGGFLIVVHTFSGNLYKVDVAKADDQVKLIEVAGGPVTLADGMELLSPTKIVVAGIPTGRLVESHDGWESASVVAKFKGPMHRMASAATVKDGRIYISHMYGMGFPQWKHAIVEAVFST